MAGAAVAQIVAVNAGDDDVTQPQMRHAARQAGRFLRIGRQRPTVADIAERAATRADVAENHEGRRAAPKTFSDIRTGGFFTDGMQVLLTQHPLDFAEAAGIVAGLGANPGRFA